MKWGWLCGWSIDRDAFRALCHSQLPGIESVVEAPTRSGLDRLLASSVEVFAGYSLGSWILLDAAARGWRPDRPVCLLAPFIAFPAEANLGGRVRRAQLRMVSRGLATDASATVLDFAARANLSIPTAYPPLRYELTEGLTLLTDLSHSTLPSVARDWKAFAGAIDPLVDAAALARHWPELQIVQGAGHDPAALLIALATEVSNHAI